MNLLKKATLKCLLLACLVLTGFKASSQDSTFRYDVLQYTIPTGWVKSLTNNYVSYTTYNKANKKKYCRIIVYRSDASCGDAKIDFSNKWKALVVNEMKTALRPGTKKVFSGENGWLVQQQEFNVDTLKQHRSVLILSFSNNQRVASVAILTNDVSYKKQIQQLASSIKPVIDAPKVKSGKGKQVIRKSQIVRLNTTVNTI